MENKRLFFAFDLLSPWPEEMPKGHLLLEKDRHLTIAFLGEAPLIELTRHLKTFPKPSFKVGLAGLFDHPVFLPKHFPRVAGWHIDWLEKEEAFLEFQKEVTRWLKERGFPPKEHTGPFLSHVTIARAPFKIQEWEKAFRKQPFYLRHLHLYESLGRSTYQSHWSYPLIAPFEEKEHTADIAFTIRGTSLEEIHFHAEIALSFQFPSLVNYFMKGPFHSLEEVIASLNRIVANADQKEGVPFKAVSYHGNLEEKEVLEWEMIVDV